MKMDIKENVTKLLKDVAINGWLSYNCYQM